jgi:hypothetical protein
MEAALGLIVTCHCMPLYIKVYNGISYSIINWTFWDWAWGADRVLWSALCWRVCRQSDTAKFQFQLGLLIGECVGCNPKVKFHLSESALFCTRPNLKSIQQLMNQDLASLSWITIARNCFPK